jgi:hypothetical protein
MRKNAKLLKCGLADWTKKYVFYGNSHDHNRIASSIGLWIIGAAVWGLPL